MMRKRGQKGFTLIELLVVVAILGVLAAVVVPNVSKFMGSGKNESGETELQNVQTAVTAMMTDAGASTVTTTATRSQDLSAVKCTVNLVDYPLSNYLVSSTTAYWYTVAADGTVTGYWAATGDNLVIGVNPAP